MTTIAPPICAVCLHRQGDLRRPQCDAFPTGIPRDILLSRADHRQAYEGDGGVLFEARDAEAAAYANFLLGPADAPPRPRRFHLAFPDDWDALSPAEREAVALRMARDARARLNREDER